MKEKFERYIPDMKALDHKFQTSKCFVCSIVQQHLPAHIIFEDDDYIAFLDKYPRQYAYSLVAPKKHLEQVTSDFSIDEYLKLQQLVYHVSEVVRQEVDAERMYILSYGSNQANAHVHWHIAPLPKGVPYEKQQGAAIGWSNGVLRIPEVEMDALAKRLEIALKKRVTN